jgi:hypothetical protein
MLWYNIFFDMKIYKTFNWIGLKFWVWILVISIHMDKGKQFKLDTMRTELRLWKVLSHKSHWLYVAWFPSPYTIVRGGGGLLSGSPVRSKCRQGTRQTSQLILIPIVFSSVGPMSITFKKVISSRNLRICLLAMSLKRGWTISTCMYDVSYLYT